MNRAKRHILFLMLVIALLAIPTFVVFAKELGLLTISGPGIKGELTLKDPKDTMKLEQSGFFDQAALAKPPKDLNLEAGYTITAHLNLDGKMVPFVQMVYYATDENQPGYVHYTARLSGESLQSVDQWHQLNKDADTAFRGLMTANKVTLQTSLIIAPAVEAPAVEPAAAPAVSASPVQTPSIIWAAVATILLLAGAGLVWRRGAISHPTT